MTRTSTEDVGLDHLRLQPQGQTTHMHRPLPSLGFAVGLTPRYTRTPDTPSSSLLAAHARTGIDAYPYIQPDRARQSNRAVSYAQASGRASRAAGRAGHPGGGSIRHRGLRKIRRGPFVPAPQNIFGRKAYV